MSTNPAACAAHRISLEVLTAPRPTRELAPRLGGTPHRGAAVQSWESRGWPKGATCGSDSISRGLRMFEHPQGSSTSQVFETRNLPLAAYLIAGRHLRYAGVRAECRRGVFIFDDPQGRGMAMEREFHSGAECPATLFHSTVKRLRREIDEAIARES